MADGSPRQITRWTHETAAQVLRGAGLEPLEPYPGRTTLPWRCRCAACGAVVAPNLNNLSRGLSRGCRYCSARADNESDSGHTRWTHESASVIMRAAGLEPLDPYPGTGNQWRCRCGVCGREVTPRFSMVRRGASKGCKYCGGRARVDAEVAVADMRAAALEPLAPYPGHTASPWRCRCTRCGSEVTARLMKIRAGEGCCKRCGVEASAATRRADAEQAAALMRAAGLEPLEPYPGGNHLPWRSRCMKCGAEGMPTRANISRGQGGCVSCGIEINAARRLGDTEQAIVDMVAAGLQPLEPYQGVNKPWRCRCTRCGSEVWPRLAHIRSRGGGCITCGYEAMKAKQRHDPDEAEREMRGAGYIPLEPYPGADHRWRCRHMPCDREVTARLSKIRRGEGACSYCARYGFNLVNPAVVYVLHNPALGAVKVGITGGDERIGKYVRNGWTLLQTAGFATGAAAWAIEQAVLRYIREEMSLSHFLTADQMGAQGGWTETFDANLLPPDGLCEMVEEERNRLQFR